jgi:hypothetical protein
LWLQVDTLDEAIALVNSNPWGNGTAIFTDSGSAARKFQHDVQVGVSVSIIFMLSLYHMLLDCGQPSAHQHASSSMMGRWARCSSSCANA